MFTALNPTGHTDTFHLSNLHGFAGVSANHEAILYAKSP